MEVRRLNRLGMEHQQEKMTCRKLRRRGSEISWIRERDDGKGRESG